MLGCLGCWIDCDSELVSRTFPIKCTVKISNAEAQYLICAKWSWRYAAITCPKTLAGLSFGGHSERGKFRIKSEKVFYRALQHVWEERNPKHEQYGAISTLWKWELMTSQFGDRRPPDISFSFLTALYLPPTHITTVNFQSMAVSLRCYNCYRFYSFLHLWGLLNTPQIPLGTG